MTAGKYVASHKAFALLAASIAIGAFGLYFFGMEPGEPGEQAEARARAEQPALNIEIASLERKVRENPVDGKAWAEIASAYFRSGNFEKAAEAFRKAIELSGESEEWLLGLAESLTLANNGEVPEPAKQSLGAALQLNPLSGRGRVWIAIVAEQEGRKADAEKAYHDMLKEDLDGPLRSIVTERLANLSTSFAESVPPHGEASGHAPKAHEGDARDSVERLAERLRQNKGSLESWLMLIRSYKVLEEPEKAQDAVARARQQFASDTNALEEIDSLARQVGSPAPKVEQRTFEGLPEGVNGPKATEKLADSDPGPMIRGMVSRLAERLKDNRGGLEDWLKLIRSYMVLKETDKAQEAAAAARQQFAGDAKALEQIDSFLQDMNFAADKKEAVPKP